MHALGGEKRSLNGWIEIERNTLEIGHKRQVMIGPPPPSSTVRKLELLSRHHLRQ